MNDKLYEQELLDHYRFPRNYGKMSDPDVTMGAVNPSCGDAISMQVRIVEERIIDVKFQGQGCVISQAAASLLTQRVINQSIATLQEMTKTDILAMIGINLGPTRLRCALLALEAVHEAIAQYNKQKTS